MDQLICASLSHTHYWYKVSMLKVPAVNIMCIDSPEKRDNNTFSDIVKYIYSNTLPSILLLIIYSNDTAKNQKKKEPFKTSDISQTLCQQDEKIIILIDSECPQDSAIENEEFTQIMRTDSTLQNPGGRKKSRSKRQISVKLYSSRMKKIILFIDSECPQDSAIENEDFTSQMRTDSTRQNPGT